MSIDILRDVLMWCCVINYTTLLLAAIVIRLAHGTLYRLAQFWIPLTTEQFDLVNYGWMALYKISILVFNLVPYIALRIVG
jgi:hypothetical protein